MTKDIELKAIDELIYEVGMFEQAGVYPIQDFIDNLKTLAAKVKEETKLEGCVVVPVEPTQAMIDAVRSEHEGEPYLPYSLYKSFLKAALGEAARGGNHE